MVIGNDVSSLKNGRLLLDALDRLDRDPDRIQVVLSQVSGRGGLSAQECERSLGRRASAILPHERLLSTAWNEGRTVLELAGRSKYSRAVTRVARGFVPAGKGGGRGWRPRRPHWLRRGEPRAEEELAG